MRVDVCAEVKDFYEPRLNIGGLKTEGYKKTDGETDGLYIPVGEGYQPQTIKFIPYYAFANRGESDMRVWMVKF